MGAAALFALAGCTVTLGTGHFWRTYHTRVSAAGLQRIEIKGDNGDVYATGGNVGAIEIRARIDTGDVTALPRDTVSLSRNGDTETIATTCSDARVVLWKIQNCGADYTIVYPRSLHIAVAVMNGDIHVTAAAAPITAATMNGDITIHDASSDIDAHSHQGDVTASLAPAWQGQNIAIVTTFGDVTLTAAQTFRATVHSHTIAGDANGVSSVPPGPANVTITTTFGDVTIDRGS